jgi:hypothetical protein
LLDVIGGTFNGNKINGDFLEGGLEQINILRNQDGTAILIHTCGVRLNSSKKRSLVDAIKHSSIGFTRRPGARISNVTWGNLLFLAPTYGNST